jgi:hypothetical protein
MVNLVQRMPARSRHLGHRRPAAMRPVKTEHLLINHRTVEIYRARLMRKYKSHTTADLVHKLMAG